MPMEVRSRNSRWHADAAGRFVLWVLAGVVTLVGVVALINTWVDPYGARPGSRYSIVRTDAIRDVKLELLRRSTHAPDVLVVGSSRAMRLDPAIIRQITGLSAFNAAVPSAGPIDAYAFARAAEHRYGRMPQVLWVVDVEGFRPRTASKAAGGDERLSRWLDDDQRPFAEFSQRLERTVSMEAVRLSVDAVRRGPRVDGGETIRLDTDKGGAGTFGADGQYAPDSPERSRAGALERGIDLKVQEYSELVYDNGYLGLDDEQVRYGERLLEYLAELGHEPLIVLPPYNPTFVERMSQTRFPERARQVRALLRTWAKRYGVRVLDCLGPSSCGVGATDYYDGVHPTGAANRAITRELHARGWLGKPVDHGESP